MAHNLTFAGSVEVTVNGQPATSPHPLVNGDVIVARSTDIMLGLVINGDTSGNDTPEMTLSDTDIEIVSYKGGQLSSVTINYIENEGGKVAHVLTISGWSNDSYYNVPTVNGIAKTNSDSPITLKNGDVIKVPTDRATVTINGTSYTSQSTTLNLTDQDIALAASGPEKTLEVYNYVTINYSEPVDYIISETELTTIADSIRIKTSSSDKLTPSAMVEKIKTIPIITDVNDAATLTAKLTENNIGNFYRYTGTATTDYATGAIYQVTQV